MTCRWTKYLAAIALWALALSVQALTAADIGAVTEAAERGSAASQVLLAIAYHNGDGGLGRDSRAAAKWFERAALQGSVYAQEALADLYEQGDGIGPNLALAADWHEKAARRGNLQAEYKLGRMYLDGRGVPRESRLAIHW